MSDPSSPEDGKIVSLDQRRRDDAARQKAEIAAQAKRAANGSGRTPDQPWGRRGPAQGARQAGARAANTDRGPTPIASAIGTGLSWLLWIVAGVALALTLWTMMSKPGETTRPVIPAEQLQTV